MPEQMFGVRTEVALMSTFATKDRSQTIPLSEMGRPEPPIASDEAATLLGYLERQRATFAWKCGGLDAAGLRATVGRSAMAIGGMLKHLARFEDDMSTEWLLGREQLPPWNSVDWSADNDWDWRTAADDFPEQLHARWRDAAGRSRALFAQALAEGGLEQAAPGITDDRGDSPSVRYVLINMIEEYARHNGHADLIRESVDGLVGHDPPESGERSRQLSSLYIQQERELEDVGWICSTACWDTTTGPRRKSWNAAVT
jgi:hypothetical protein